MSLLSSLAQLIRQLRQLPSETPSHLQHLSIRVQRAKSLAERGRGIEGLELLVRLKGRLEELEHGLDELQTLGNDHHQLEWSELKRAAESARRALEQDLQNATATVEFASTSSSHSVHDGLSSPSHEVPQRTPATSLSRPLPSANLDAFLSRIQSTASSPSQPSLSLLAQKRAESLSYAYSLFLLATSPRSILPQGQSLSTVFRNGASSSRPSSSSSVEAARALTTTSLKQIGFYETCSDDLASRLSNDAMGTWKTICQDLAEACLPLIPARLGQGSVKKRIEDLLQVNETRTASGAEAYQTKADRDNRWNLDQSFETVRTLLIHLRRLCAPVRDPQIANILNKIEGIHTIHRLVETVQETLRLSENMREDLQNFREDVGVGLAGEEEILEVVREEAAARERKIVGEIVRAEGDFESKEPCDEIRIATEKWIRVRGDSSGTGAQTSELPITKEDVAKALIEALFDDQADCIPPISAASHNRRDSSSSSPSPDLNTLPPTFYSTLPRLFELQNRFQALTILACLLTILAPFTNGSSSGNSSSTSRREHPPTSTPHPPPLDPHADDLVSRLWTILTSEIPSFSSSSSTFAASQGDPLFTTTILRLAHLSDELISHLEGKTRMESTSATRSNEWNGWKEVTAEGDDMDTTTRTTTTTPETVKQKIRESVDRILKSQDPVFRLLRTRLKEGTKEAVLTALRDQERKRPEREGGRRTTGETRAGEIPTGLRTGSRSRVHGEDNRDKKKRQLSSWLFASTSSMRTQETPGFKAPLIKGYERLRPTLDETLKEKFEPVWVWVDQVWGTSLGW